MKDPRALNCTMMTARDFGLGVQPPGDNGRARAPQGSG